MTRALELRPFTRPQRTLSTLPGWNAALRGAREVVFCRGYLTKTNALELCADWIPPRSVTHVSVILLVCLAIGVAFQVRHGDAETRFPPPETHAKPRRGRARRPRLRELPGWDEALAEARRKHSRGSATGAWIPPEQFRSVSAPLVFCLARGLSVQRFSDREARRRNNVVNLQHEIWTRQARDYDERRPATWGIEKWSCPWAVRDAFLFTILEDGAREAVDEPKAEVISLDQARERLVQRCVALALAPSAPEGA